MQSDFQLVSQRCFATKFQTIEIPQEHLSHHARIMATKVELFTETLTLLSENRYF